MRMSDIGTTESAMAYYAGIDLGASHIRAAVANSDANVLGTGSCPTPRGPTGIDITEAVLSMIRRASDDAGITPQSIVVAGIGSIGPLDLAAGVIENPANLPDTIDRIPLTGPVGSLIGGDRVVLRNDADAGLVGERFYGDYSPDDMIYLTISSGIGAGIAVDGSLLSGWDGNAGEIGHLTVDPDGEVVCGCGHTGHWEAYCSGNNIPAYVRHLYESARVETALPISDPSFAAPDLFALSGEDEFADSVIERLAEWNAIGLANLVHAYAPITISVGGAVALNNPELVVDPINERLSDLVLTNVPDVQLTSLTEDVVVHGALASALRADGHTRPENPAQLRK